MSEAEKRALRRLRKKRTATLVYLDDLGHVVTFTSNGFKVEVGRCKHCNYLTLITLKKSGKRWKAWGTMLSVQCPRSFP